MNNFEICVRIDSFLTSLIPTHLSGSVSPWLNLDIVEWCSVRPSVMSLYVSVFYSSCPLKKLANQTWLVQHAEPSNLPESEREIIVNLKYKECNNISFARLNFPCERHFGVDNRNKILFLLSFLVSVTFPPFSSGNTSVLGSFFFSSEIFPEQTVLCNYHQLSLISQMRNDRMHVESRAHRHGVTSCIQKQTHF